MADIFSRIGDSFKSAQGATRTGSDGDPQGFSESATVTLANGFSSPESRIPPRRDAVAVRHMVRWFVPESGIVEMYINPQSIKINEKKSITESRTRNGFVAQYWGEDLMTIDIQGTTGSSGIEGINVLRDVYRNEQLAIDPLAIMVANYREQQNMLSTGDLGQGFTKLFDTAQDDAFRTVNNLVQYGTTNPTRPRPTLASMACTVEMYWSGWVFRGWFMNFNIDETANNLGLFNYNLNFKVTQMRGQRLNFMPWHRSPTAGPSNSDPQFGTPYSYGGLRNQIPQSINVKTPNVTFGTTSINKSLQSDLPLYEK